MGWIAEADRRIAETLRKESGCRNLHRTCMPSDLTPSSPFDEIKTKSGGPNRVISDRKSKILSLRGEGRGIPASVNDSGGDPVLRRIALKTWASLPRTPPSPLPTGLGTGPLRLSGLTTRHIVRHINCSPFPLSRRTNHQPSPLFSWLPLSLPIPNSRCPA